MSAGRVSRIQQRYEANIAANNQRNYASYNSNQRRNNNVNNNTRNNNNNNNNNNNRGQPQQANNWQESVRNGFTTFREARPVQGLAELVTQTVPKAAAFGWTRCTTDADTTWEEFDFGNNPFKGRSFFGGGAVQQQDFHGDILDDFNDIVERDPFAFDVKPNQPVSRRHREEPEIAPNSWANFNAFPQYQAFEVVQAARYNSYATPSTAPMTDDDTFYDHGEKMFNVKAIPITEVIPIDNVSPVFMEQLPHQMSDPVDLDDDTDLEDGAGNARTKSARFRPFGGNKKVELTVSLPSLKLKSVQDEDSLPIRKKDASPARAPKLSKEEERLRKKEEQRIKELEEEKEREEERIRRKEERLKREEERLQRERERILEEEERMMREEEERERRREERLRQEEEILRLREERKERQLRKQHELDFARIEQIRQPTASVDPFGLDFEDVDIENADSQEVDWQGFPPLSSSSKPKPKPSRRRDDSREREYERRERRRPREPREPIKIECPTCPTFDCACCPTFYHKNQKWINLVIVLLFLAGLGIGIYAAVAGDSAFGGGGDDLSTDCKAVMAGFSVPGESMYPIVRLSWVMDVSMTEKKSMTQLSGKIGSQFQDVVVPTLAGCLLGDGPMDSFVVERFDIVNGYVRSVRDVGSCRYGEIQPCARVLVDFVVFVKGDAPTLDLIAHLSAQYTGSVINAMEQLPMVRKTNLVGLFEQRT